MEELTFYIVLAMVMLFIAIFGTAIIFLAYSGLFNKVDVGAGQPPIQEVTLAYHFGRGPYKNSGYYFCELTSLAPNLRALGIYYDDPQQVEADKLRWVVGCVVAKESEKPDEEQVQILQQKGYKLITLPSVTNAVRAKFPNTTFLSFFLGIYKVYPALANYIREHKLCAHPFLEIYDQTEIHYVVPLACQNEFYVPESLEDEEGSDGVGTDLSSDEGTPEKEKTEVMEQQPASMGGPSAGEPSEGSSAKPTSPTKSAMRDSLDRQTPVEAIAKAEPKEATQPKAHSIPAAPSSTPSTPSQPGSPTAPTKAGPEGESSSEVDSETYDFVKPEDIAAQSN